jgi:hypothetical protein
MRRHPHHAPAKRLLVFPALLVVALVVGLQQVHALHQRAPFPGVEVDPDQLPAAIGPPVVCDRTDPDRVARARPASGAVGRVTSEIVTACPAAYDGRRVTYVGELIGDLLRRDGGAWVLVNDDDYALQVGPLPGHPELRGTNSGLSVWLPDPLPAAVTGLGRPNVRGDVVEIVGVVHRADPADGEGLTLRADRLRVLTSAHPVAEPLDLPQLWFALGAAAVAGALWLVRRRAEAGW